MFLHLLFSLFFLFLSLSLSVALLLFIYWSWYLCLYLSLSHLSLSFFSFSLSSGHFSHLSLQMWFQTINSSIFFYDFIFLSNSMSVKEVFKYNFHVKKINFSSYFVMVLYSRWQRGTHEGKNNFSEKEISVYLWLPSMLAIALYR